MNIPKKIMNSITELFVNEIGERALDGITYCLIEDKYKKAYSKYKKIQDELLDSGFAYGEVLRVYKLNNGYIFDIDFEVIVMICKYIFKAIEKSQKEMGRPFIGFKYDEMLEIKKFEYVRLMKYIVKQYKNNKDAIEVALYNRTTGSEIFYRVEDSNKKKALIKYEAYKIRHWDLEEVSRELHKRTNIKIKAIEINEILPNGDGVRCIIYFERGKDNED